VLFAVLWAVAGVFHLLSFHDWRWWSIYGIFLAIAALAVLARPTWPVFAFFVLVDFACVGRNISLIPNHILFAWVVNLTLLTTLAGTLIRRPGEKEIAGEWFRAFAPWLRLELGILYFITGFHKLNTAYFNPEVSCAVSMLHEVAATFPFVPTASWAESGVIHGTIVGEALIPLLVAMRSTRLAGLLLGITFHGLLTTHFYVGIYSFTATVYALFSLFLPGLCVARLALPTWLRILPRIVAVAGITGLMLWMFRHRLFAGGVLESYFPKPLFGLGIVAALAYALGSFGVISWLGYRHPGDFRNPAPGTFRRLWPMAVFPAVLALIGLQPYLGFRTLMCFSMFSNLQTENGRSNHFLMPNWLQITDWQRDLVEVIESNEPGLSALAEEQLSIPFLELRRRRTVVASSLTVVFSRKGQVFKFVSDDVATHRAIPPLGRLAMYYVRFRAVESDPDKVHCRW